MLNQSIKDQTRCARRLVDQSAQWTTSISSRIGRFFTAAHYVLTLVGIVALFILSMMFFNPSFADKIIDLSPFSDGQAEAAFTQPPSLSNLMDMPATAINTASPATLTSATLTDEERNMLGTPHQQKLITNWLSKRYRVASDATHMLVTSAYLTAHEIKLDPLLILAVMAIESRFNPFAESPMGAQGLMQVMSKVHHDKFQELGGVKAALNPVANIKVGSLILKEYVTRGGSVEAGLKSYVGAAALENDGGYGAKVLSEYRNLKDVATGKRVSIFASVAVKPRLVAAQPKPNAVSEIAAAQKEQDANLSKEITAL